MFLVKIPFLGFLFRRRTKTVSLVHPRFSILILSVIFRKKVTLTVCSVCDESQEDVRLFDGWADVGFILFVNGHMGSSKFAKFRSTFLPVAVQQR